MHNLIMAETLRQAPGTASPKQRASRLPLHMKVALRPAGDLRWQGGRTLNVSCSGVLVELDTDRPPEGHVEFVLKLTTPGAFLGVSDLHCTGRIVRAENQPGGHATIAATIDTYCYLPPATH